MIGTCPSDISCHVHMYLALYFAFLNGFDFSFLSIISLNVRDEMLEMYSALLLLNYKMPFSLYALHGHQTKSCLIITLGKLNNFKIDILMHAE